MKRLLARGCSRLFQICPCFRKEEVGRYHQTEFTMLEWYRAGWGYHELMAECEEFLGELAIAVPDLDGVADTDTLRWQGRSISLARPWEKLTVTEAFLRYAGLPVREAMEQDMFEEVLVTRIEPRLGWDTPVFLYDYPVELGSLARRKVGDAGVAERFELYIGGIELANGFSELTDPFEQRKRFVAEMEKAGMYGTMYMELPEKFLTDLAGLGDTAGIALGFDRLFMLLAGCSSVAEAMPIPLEEL